MQYKRGQRYFIKKKKNWNLREKFWDNNIYADISFKEIEESNKSFFLHYKHSKK